MRTILFIVWFIAPCFILGLIGNCDYRDEVATAAQTAEIKSSMQQRAISEARDDAAYRELFLNREVEK